MVFRFSRDIYPEKERVMLPLSSPSIEMWQFSNKDPLFLNITHFKNGEKRIVESQEWQ
jgi:hypothetical protein